VHDAARGIVGHGGNFPNLDAAGGFLEEADIGEGAARIDADAPDYLIRALGSTLSRRNASMSAPAERRRRHGPTAGSRTSRRKNAGADFGAGDRREARADLCAAFPAFKSMRVAESWAGLIDFTPDAGPVISPVENLPGFFLATGFSGQGFGIGPGAGKFAADLVAGDTPAVDPTPYRFERFR
jgi:glycine/D-amino acid oxidase-like deaminating enzyme